MSHYYVNTGLSFGDQCDATNTTIKLPIITATLETVRRMHLLSTLTASHCFSPPPSSERTMLAYYNMSGYSTMMQGCCENKIGKRAFIHQKWLLIFVLVYKKLLIHINSHSVCACVLHINENMHATNLTWIYFWIFKTPLHLLKTMWEKHVRLFKPCTKPWKSKLYVY